MFGDWQVINDIKNIGIKDLFDVYSGINQQKIARGVVESQNQIDRMKAEAELYNQQWLRNSTQTAGAFVMDKRLITFAVLAGLGVVAYKLIK